MTEIAEKSGLGRESLYKAVSPRIEMSKVNLKKDKKDLLKGFESGEFI